jgi:hypothetical protein
MARCREGKLEPEAFVAECFPSLGKENVRLTNFVFTRLLRLKHPLIDNDPELKTDLLLVLADYLHTLKYIEKSPVVIDYTIDPALTIDEVIDRILSARMPTWSPDDIGGTNANIDSLTGFFATALRQYELIAKEKSALLKRLRQWIGHAGFKLSQGQAITQRELTALCMYGSTRDGSYGHSTIANGTIPAAETGDPLVKEAGTLYESVTLAGPWHQHFKVISDQMLQRLTAAVTPHVADLKKMTGFFQPFGPFIELDVTPSEAIIWNEQEHLAGLTARTSILMSSIEGSGAFAIRTPSLSMNRGKYGAPGIFADDPAYRVTPNELTEKDVSRFDSAFYSEWRGLSISTRTHSAMLDLAIVDKCLKEGSFGTCKIEHATLEAQGLMLLRESAAAKVKQNPTRSIVENYLLPQTNGKVALQEVDMTAYYGVVGSVEVLPALSEFLVVSDAWFHTPAPNVVDYVAAMTALPYDEKRRFTTIIELYHNIARYEKITGQKAGINALAIARAQLSF